MNERSVDRLIQLQEEANEHAREAHAEWADSAERQRQAVETEFASVQAHRAKCAAEMGTLRDEFAKAAIPALVASPHTESWRDVAEQAYEIADAMLEARK